MVVRDAVFAYEGMVLTIEPMINTGTWEIDTDMETGWAHKTLDGGLSCQYEHQFVITKMVQWSWLVKVKKEHTKTREERMELKASVWFRSLLFF